jgi:hypothetical protein
MSTSYAPAPLAARLALTLIVSSLLPRAPTNPGGLSDRAILYIAAAAVALLVVSIVGCIVCCRRTRRAAPSAVGDDALRAEVVELRAEVAKLRAAQPSDQGDGFVPPPPLYDVKADMKV